MTTRRTAQLFLIIFSFVFCQCGLQQPFDSLSSTTIDQGSVGYEVPVGSAIEKLSISNGGVSIDFENTDSEGQNDAVLIIYANDISANGTFFKLHPKNLEGTSYLTKESSEVAKQSFESGELTFDDYLREFEESIDEDAELPELDETAQLQYLSKGSSRRFNVINTFSASSYETIEATLRYENEFVKMYVDQRDDDSFSDDELATLAENFSELIAVECELFGDASDVNDDGKIAALFSRVVNKIGASQGGIVTGYFYAPDLMSKKKYPSSNEMEIIHSLVPDPEGAFGVPVSKSFALNSIIPGVLPHELQHMINFNQHYFVSAVAPEQGWLNEALSHFAEDLITVNDDGVIEGYGTENPARVADYLSGINQICFTCGTSLSQRGGAYLFLKYLYSQAEKGSLPAVKDGYELLQKLVQTKKVGVNNVITTALGASATEDDFKELLGLFALSVYFTDSGIAGADSYNILGMTLRGAAEDYRGTYLQGPAMLDMDSPSYQAYLAQTGLLFLQIPRYLIEESEHQFRLSFNQSADKVGVYLIQP